MNHPEIDAIFGDMFVGQPVTPGETWPRLDAFDRQGYVIVGVPDHYALAIQLYSLGRVVHAVQIESLLSQLCRGYDYKRVRAAIAAWTRADAPAA